MQQALSQSFLKMTEFISLYTWCKENKKGWLVEQWEDFLHEMYNKLRNNPINSYYFEKK